MLDKFKSQNYSYKSNNSNKNKLYYDIVTKYRQKNTKTGLENNTIEFNKKDNNNIKNC